MNARDANRKEIAGRIAALLTHYWSSTEPAAVRQAQLNDWLEDLEEFPAELVGEACRDYRRSADRARRPLPGDIRMICIRIRVADATRVADRKAIADARSPWPDWLAELWGPAPMGPSDRAAAIAQAKDREREQLRRRLGNPNAKLSSEMTEAEKIAEGQRVGNEWAQARGFSTLNAYAAAKGLSYEEARDDVCQSFLKGSPIASVIKDTAAKKRSDFNWTAEQLKAGRDELVRLGHIDPPEEEPR